MSRPNPLSFDPASKDGHRGLSMRLARKAIEEADETPRLFLPVFRFPQVPDQLKEAK